MFEYSYDGYDRMVGVSYKESASSAAVLLFSYNYDELDNIISIVDHLTNTTYVFEYDENKVITSMYYKYNNEESKKLSVTLIKDSNEEINKHEHVIFTFLDDTDLRYHDTRKFGKMLLIPKDEILECKQIKELGLEPWDNKLTSFYLMDKYKNKKLPIKSVLLEQSIITGIGNIYADEILFLSKINPCQVASSLTNENCEEIIKHTREVLERAIELGGTTIRSYESSEGVHGRFQINLLVHNRKDENCPNCGTPITKIVVGGRGTYYCKVCQK